LNCQGQGGKKRKQRAAASFFYCAIVNIDFSMSANRQRLIRVPILIGAGKCPDLIDLHRVARCIFRYSVTSFSFNSKFDTVNPSIQLNIKANLFGHTKGMR
jgi:hypothetical protein